MGRKKKEINTKNKPKPTGEKRQRGRPRVIPRDLIITKLCQKISKSNKSLDTCLREINQELNQRIDNVMIFDWLDKDVNLARQYARAKEEQADYLVDEMLQIADDSSEDDIFVECDDKSGKSARRVCNNEFVQRSRLRVDTRKWIAAKLKPKRYGDKLDLNPAGPVEFKITVVYDDKAAQ